MMKKIRSFLLKMDILLVCIIAGISAENGMKHFANNIVNNDNQPVMNDISNEFPSEDTAIPSGMDNEMPSEDTAMPSGSNNELSSGDAIMPDGGGNEVSSGDTAMPQDMVKKKIALTFDDGPNANYTEMLLAGLKERGVCATFFLLGKEVDRHPEIVEEMYADGHLIGNHSYDHVNLGSLSAEAAIEQVDETNEVIYEVTGEYPQYIRPPFGSWKTNLDYATSMIEVLWDVDTFDT